MFRKSDTSWIEGEYDKAAGWYVSKGTYPPIIKHYDEYAKALAKEIKYFSDNPKSIMEAGVGESSTLSILLQKIESIPDLVSAFDVSWSKIAYSRLVLKKHNVDLFVGDLTGIALPDNSIEVVYTSHAIESNRGKEKIILEELYRVSSKYIILLEPIYELGDRKMKKHMRHYNYIRGLKKICKKLKYNVVKYGLFSSSLSKTNKTGIIVIEKNASSGKYFYQCPKTGCRLSRAKSHLYSSEADGVYPMLDGIPMLKSSNFILASKFSDKIKIPK